MTCLSVAPAVTSELNLFLSMHIASAQTAYHIPALPSTSPPALSASLRRHPLDQPVLFFGNISFYFRLYSDWPTVVRAMFVILGRMF